MIVVAIKKFFWVAIKSYGLEIKYVRIYENFHD